MTKPYTLHRGDCIEVMRGMADNSVDAVVTDPPYELGFMGKSWDASGIAYNLDVWREALRVLKPGGHLLAFSGARTQHRMVCAIEDAGFEVRDQIMWVFGSGFPKSQNVSKALDKTGGVSVAWFGPWLKRWRDERDLSQKELCERCGFFGKVNRGGTIANWELGLGQPTVDQFNRICEVLALPFDSMEAAEREVISQQQQGKLAVAPGQSNDRSSVTLDITAPATDVARQWEGWGTALKPAHEPICVARKPLAKGHTVAANVLAFGTGAINVDGCRVEPTGESRARIGEASQGQRYADAGSTNFAATPGVRAGAPEGRWPANIIHDGSAEVVALFPDAKGQQGRVTGDEPTANGFSGAVKFGGMLGRIASAEPRVEIETSAARFFYCAKASRADRNAGLVDPGPQFEHGSTLRKIEDAIALNVTSYELKGDAPDWVKESVERFLSQSI